MITTSLPRRVRNLYNSRFALSLVALGLLVIGTIMPSSQPAQATAGAINNQINFQGRLLNAAGAVVADGNYNMQFKIYRDGTGTAASNPGGTLLWTEEWLNSNGTGEGVNVKNGYFSIQLGLRTTLPATLNESVLWLSMNVAGTPNQTSSCATPFLTNCTPDGEMVPMKRLGSAVYALNAQSCITCILQAPGSTAQNIIAPTVSSVTALTVNGTTGGTAATAVSIAQTGNASNLALTNSGSTNTNLLSVTHSTSAFAATAIFVNVANASGTFASGNFVDLQANGVSKFKIDNLGALTLAGGQTADITTLAGTAAAALVFQPGNTNTATSTGAAFTLQAGNDSGATAATGGLLTLKGGNATGGGTQNAGGVTIDSGSGTNGGTISLGGTNSATIQIGNAVKATTIDIGNLANTSNRTITIAGGNTANAVSDTVNIATGNAVGTGSKVVNIATGTPAGANTVTIGSVAGTSTVVLQGGAGTAAGDINIGDQTTASKILDIGSNTNAGTGTVRIATGAAVQTVQIGSTNSTSTLTLQGGTGTVGGDINIGDQTTLGKIIDIASVTNSGTSTVNIATNTSAVQSVNIGSTNSTSTTTLYGGTGNIILQANQAGAGTVVQSNTTNSVTAFRVQNASSVSALTVDTTANRVSVGGNGTDIGQLYAGGNVPAAAVGTLNFTGSPGPSDVYVVGRYAYVTGFDTDALRVVDVSNPASPTQMSTMTIAGDGPNGVVVQGKYAYVINTNSRDIEVLDVSNPTAPVSQLRVTLGAAGNGGNDITVAGRYLYATDQNGDLTIFDIANPAVPVQVGLLNLNAFNASAVEVRGKYVYVVGISSGGNQNTFYIVDASNPASPTLVNTGGTNLSGTSAQDAYSLDVVGRYAYIPTGDGNTLQIFDISTPATPTQASNTAISGTQALYVQVQGRYAYVLENNGNRIEVFDVSNPAAPAAIDNVATGNDPFGLFIQGRYMYAPSYGTTDSLLVYDIGGAYLQQLEAGGIEATTLATTGRATLANATVQGGLQVGESIQANSIGTRTLQVASGSTTAFQVLNASSNAILTVDTTGNDVEFGKLGSGGINAKLSLNTATAGNYITTISASGSQGANIDYTLPTSVPGANQCLSATAVSAPAVTFGWAACAGGSGDLQAAYNASSSPATITTSAAGKGLAVTANFIPTVNLVNIDATVSTGVTTAGVNGLAVSYRGGAAAVEASAIQATMTPGTTASGIWSAMRLSQAATGAAVNVIQIGLKVDDLTTPGAGSERAINVGSGWDVVLQAANVAIAQNGNIDTNGIIRTGLVGLGGTAGKLSLASTNTGSILSSISTSASQAASFDYVLPAVVAVTGECLKAGTVAAPSIPLVFGSCGAGGARLDQITAATGTTTIANTTNAINWNWQFAAAGMGLNFGETAASTGGSANQWLLQSSTLSGSTASPLRVTSNSVDAADIGFNLASAGDLEIQDAGVAFATFDDSGNITLGKGTAASQIDIGVGTGADTINIGTGASGTDGIIIGNTGTASATTLRQGSGNLTVNLGGTGDFVLQDNASAFLTISDAGGFDLTLDATDNPGYLLTNNGSGNVVTNLAGTGDFIVQDAGAAVLTVLDSGLVGVGTGAPDNAMTVQGDMNIRDAAVATKQYRFRTSGAALDMEAAGANLWLSGWTGSNFTGTQTTWLRGNASATTPYLNVGAGVGSAVPTVLFLDEKDVASGAGDPALAFRAGMYYNDALDKFRCYEESAWENCIPDLQGAYNNDAAGAPAEILTSSTTKTVRVKAGSSFDTADLFTVQTAAGVSMLAVSTNGTPSVDIGATAADTISSTIDIANTSSGTGTQIVNIGSNANAANAVKIEGGNTGRIDIAESASAHTVRIGTSAATNNIFLGSQNTSSKTTINGGDAANSGYIRLLVGAGGPITVGSNSTTTAQRVELQGGNITTTNGNSGIIVGAGYANSGTDLVPFTLDSSTSIPETASTCTATVNGGTLYYNSNAASNAIRACINGSWEDLISTGGMGLLAFGVIADSANAGSVGDLAGISGNNNSPCKVHWASATSVTVAPCVAYSGGRKVVVASTTLSINNASAPHVNLAASAFANICLDGTNNQPQFKTSNATENLAAVPTWSQSNPVLCLATVQASTTAGSFAGTGGKILDIRTFTNTVKTFATLNAAAALGVAVVQSATINQVAMPAGVASASVRGIIVGYSGAASSTIANVIIATSGPQFVKATGTSAVNSIVQTTNTSGYTQTAALSATGYANLGVSTRTIDTTCTAIGNCQYSQFLNPIAVR